MGDKEKYTKVIKMIFAEIGIEKEPTFSDLQIFMYVPYNKLCARFVLKDLKTMTDGQVRIKYGLTKSAIFWIKSGMLHELHTTE
jgi:hypothetical protein